ncbi:MAG TPA: pyridoxamine 5'-phosphate oxidase family protein [Candidatus Limnocylindrales bacterium]|jgi:PPOX class probable F420-dependent enzyme|nr:pyridoxamine 5'-phosphate oxidase family protein [Candidatus Limnocylindrales bacterium]
MQRSTLAATRLIGFLETEPVVWLSTVGQDGAPHLVPTWFAWDGEAIVIRSKPGAVKVRNLLADPRAMLALGDALDDFDVGLLTARAEFPDGPDELDPAFLAKYRDKIADLGLTPLQFARTYSREVRLVPDRALGWRGRSRPDSVIAAARRLAKVVRGSLSEPISPAAGKSDGEPLARPARVLPAGA